LTFKVVAYVTPILGAWLADAHIGRYRAIILGIFVCGVAHLLQILGALPFVLQSGKGLPPFLTSAVLLAIGAGASISIPSLVSG
jgi:dipeptide/tripeptide permease